MQQFFVNLMGNEMGTYAYYVFLIIAVLLIIYLGFMILRILRRPRFAGGRRSKQARLAITDAAAVDEKRRLVLVRRENSFSNIIQLVLIFLTE